MSGDTRTADQRRPAALRIALTYAVLGALWILGSDWLLAQMVADADLRQQIGAVKGWAFVGVTAALLYWLLARAPEAAAAPAAAMPRKLVAAAGAAAVIIVLLTLQMVRVRGEQFDARLVQQVESMAEVRAREVSHWFLVRREQAGQLRDDLSLTLPVARWLDQNDAASRRVVLERLQAARAALGPGNHVALIRANGEVLAGDDVLQRSARSPELMQVLGRALVAERVYDTNLYGKGSDAAPGQVWLDVVAPLPGASGRAAVLLRADASATLLPRLREWSGGLASAQSRLVRQQGGQLVGAFTPQPRPLSTPSLLAAMAIRGEVPLGKATRAKDVTGAPVLGAVQAVAGTDWYVTSKVELDDIDAARRSDVAWVVASGVLALFAAVAGIVIAHERRQAAASREAQAQQAERLRSMQLMQAVADSSSDAIFAKDLQGRYLVCNREALRALRRSVDEVLGVDDRQLMSPAEADAVMANDARVIAEDRVLTYEETVTTAQGPRLYQATKGPMRDASGQVFGMFGISRDITEQMAAAAELERHRNRLQEMVDERTAQLRRLNESLVRGERFMRTIADSMPGMVAYWDRDLRCRFANRAYCDWFGRAWTQMDGIALAELLSPDRMQAIAPFAERALLGESMRLPSLVAVSPSGRRMEALADYIPDVEDGKVRGFLLVVTDLTEVRQAEKRLQEANEALALARDHAEAASRAKSAFLANMSHEIRTPLNAVLGLTYLMRRDAREPVQADRLRRVDSAATHLLKVIDDVLDLSKIEAGRVVMEDLDFALDEVLDRARAFVAEPAAAKGLALSIDADGVPTALRGDPTRLAQMLLNLLANAVKFTERGSVDVRVALVSREAESLRLRFEVRDTGIGIDPADLRALFTPFSQVDASTTRRFGGTGLGLAITQRLAMLMGGESGVDSQPGVGSRFWFTVALRPARGQAGRGTTAIRLAPDEALRRHAAGARVLLAEDNEVNQEVACELLRAAGLQVDVAGDGQAAVQAACQGAYDLVLMDMQMPALDGLEATRRIRAAGRAMPIIAMTANAFGEDRVACLEAGMDEHIAKPVDPDALYEVLLRHLPRRDGAPEPAQRGA